jgi:hypothetical protein
MRHLPFFISSNRPTDCHVMQDTMEEHSFNEVLGEQLQRAPYLIASLFLHFLIGLFVMGILVLTAKQETPPPQFVAAAAEPPPVIEEDPIVEPIVETPLIPEPVVNDIPVETEEPSPTLEDDGDPEMTAKEPLEAHEWNGVVGLGGGAGGNQGSRGGPGGAGGASPTEAAVAGGLQWLKDHQSPGGFWDADGFMHHDLFADQAASDGAGNPVNDVGLTGLALLAFLGNNHTLNSGAHQAVVRDGITWLLDVQQDRGLFGEEAGNSTLYNQAIATMALGEAYYFSGQAPMLKRPMTKAVNVLVRARNPYGAWRYELEPNGDSDSSITGWMVFALKTAQETGIAIDKGAFDGAEIWFDSMQDKNTGRVGYTWGGDGGGVGSLPSRPSNYIEKFPAYHSESLTAVALLSRIFMTDSAKVKRWSDHPNYAMLKKQADLIASKPPRWDENDGSIDLYYWYYGTFAMNQWGGKHWKNWQNAIEAALLPNQRRENPKDNFYGSWNPAGPWGEEGGRVYSTAICTLMMEVYYRYSRVLGAR